MGQQKTIQSRMCIEGQKYQPVDEVDGLTDIRINALKDFFIWST